MFQETETQTSEYELMKRLGQTATMFNDNETQDVEYLILKRLQR